MKTILAQIPRRGRGNQRRKAARNIPGSATLRLQQIRVSLLFYIVSLLVPALPVYSQNSPADGPWSGSIQCQLDVEQPGYSRHEIQTWTLTSSTPTEKNGDIRIYSATWTVTGQGGLQRQGLRAAVARWNVNVPSTSAPIAMFIRASDRKFIIRQWHSLQSLPNAVAGTRQALMNGAAAQPSAVSLAASEWQLPWIATDASADISGTFSVQAENLGGDLAQASPPASAACKWQFANGNLGAGGPHAPSVAATGSTAAASGAAGAASAQTLARTVADGTQSASSAATAATITSTPALNPVGSGGTIHNVINPTGATSPKTFGQIPLPSDVAGGMSVTSPPVGALSTVTPTSGTQNFAGPASLGHQDFAVGPYPIGIAFDGANIWVTTYSAVPPLQNSVVKLRASDGANLGTFPTGRDPFAIVFDGANVWITNHGDSTVTKLRASDGANLGTFPTGILPRGIVFDGTNVWVACKTPNLTKLRASDGANLGLFGAGLNGVPDTIPVALAFDGANIWVTSDYAGSVSKLRASDGTVLGKFPTGTPAPTDPSDPNYWGGRSSFPQGVVFDGANIWVANQNHNNVTKLRASDGTNLGNFPTGAAPTGLVFDGTNIWVTNAGDGTVSKLRASDGANLGVLSTGGLWLVFDGTHVWATNPAANTVTRF